MNPLAGALDRLVDALRGLSLAECSLEVASEFLAESMEGSVAAELREEILRATEGVERLLGRVYMATVGTERPPAVDLEDMEARAEAALPPSDVRCSAGCSGPEDLPCPLCGARGAR